MKSKKTQQSYIRSIIPSNPDKIEDEICGSMKNQKLEIIVNKFNLSKPEFGKESLNKIETVLKNKNNKLIIINRNSFLF